MPGPSPRPRQRSKTIGAVRIVRHLHKVGAGWTLYTSGERRAWFRNSHDLEAWLGANLGYPLAEQLIEALGELDA